MSNLFIVESPLQLLNAVEARYFFQDPINVLVFSTWGEQERYANSIQIKKLISEETWTDIIRFGGYQDRINPFSLWAKLRRRHNIKRVFVGDVGSAHMRAALLNPRQENFLLDDGVGTIDAQDWFAKRGSASVSCYEAPYDYTKLRGCEVPSWKIMLKKYLCNIPATKYSGPINLFTVFDVKPVGQQKIIKNRYEALRLKKTDKKIDSSIAWFFGHGPSEEGGLTLAEEAHILKKIGDYYLARQIRVHYMPHRNENIKRLKLCREELGMVIETPEWPAEIETVIRRQLPAHIAALGSTTLFTLPILHDFATVTSFRITPRKSAYSQAVDEYLSARIAVVDLKLDDSSLNARRRPDFDLGHV